MGNEELNAYEEMLVQAASGKVVACIPVNINGRDCIFVSASDPSSDSSVNINDAWANDRTDYSGWRYGQDYFGHEGIGLAYAVAIIRYSHAIADDQGLNPVCSRHGSDSS